MYNVACSLRAFAIVQQQHADARLTVVGEGSQRKELERLASTLGLRNVTFAGKVLPDRMREYYSDADIYLNSPNIDNMPNSVIEAFAAGPSARSTDAGGIPDACWDLYNRFLSRCDPPASLGGHVLAVLREPGAWA